MDEDETEEERKERLKSEKNSFWNWYEFIYTLAQGRFMDIDNVLNQNYKLALNHKLFELKHKKIREYYDFGRYNIRDWK